MAMTCCRSSAQLFNKLCLSLLGLALRVFRSIGFGMGRNCLWASVIALTIPAQSFAVAPAWIASLIRVLIASSLARLLQSGRCLKINPTGMLGISCT